MKETTKAYLAGLFDGEGCIQIRGSIVPRLGRRQVVLGVKLGMQSQEAVYTFAKAVGAKFAAHNQGYGGVYECVIWQKKARDILEEMLPYLTTKRQRAIFAIWFYDTAFAKRPRGAVKLTKWELVFRDLCSEMMSLLNQQDSMLFHGKSGEFSEKLNTLQDSLKCMLTLNQAAMGEGVAEGATTSQVSPNNNPDQERPTSIN